MHKITKHIKNEEIQNRNNIQNLNGKYLCAKSVKFTVTTNQINRTNAKMPLAARLLNNWLIFQLGVT